MNQEIHMKTPWWVWLPIAGFIGANIQHARAIRKHAKACKDYWAGINTIDNTWLTFNLTDIWFGNLTKAMIVTVSFLGLLLIFVHLHGG